MRFKFDDKILLSIASKDETVGKLFSLIGDVEIEIRHNYFEALMMSIIGQQLSSKAAATIKNRVRSLCATVDNEITPKTLNSLSFEQLRVAGVSKAKVSYIYDLADKVDNGNLSFDQILDKDNHEIIKALTTVKGIGKWTAEMFLIFSLGRLNVLSTGDVGLQRATKWLYNMTDRVDSMYLEQHGHKWSPFESIVSLYLWEAIDQGYVDSGKNIEEIVKD